MPEFAPTGTLASKRDDVTGDLRRPAGQHATTAHGKDPMSTAGINRPGVCLR